jgi:starch phosphorylase
MAYDVLRDMIPWHIRDVATQNRLSMTHLALNLSQKTNSVSKKHQEVCREMFPGYPIENITNGVHHIRWSSHWTQELFDRHLPDWRSNPKVLSSAPKNLPRNEVWDAHMKGKHDFISWLNAHPEFFYHESGLEPDDLFDPDILTIGFARRFVPYKRPTLIFRNLERLRKIGYKKIQLVFAGRCHPDDQFCISQREALRHFAQEMRGQIRIVVIPGYNVHISKKMVTGCDMWLNNPIVPREASGTSGMKVALNGGLNLSILDGWWIEGLHRAPRAGWGFGDHRWNMSDFDRNKHDSEELYAQLEKAIKCYYKRNKKEWIDRMKDAMSLMGYFNTKRCIEEYDTIMWDDSYEQ